MWFDQSMGNFSPEPKDPSGNPVVFAFNEKDEFVGDEQMGEFLENMNVSPEMIEGDNICCIGFNEAEQKWYGWSHRAICGFGVGATVKLGDCAYKPSNRAEFIIWLENWYSDNENLKVEPVVDGVKISYDVPDYNPEPVDQSLVEELKEAFPKGRIEVMKPFTAHRREFVEKYPDTWGKGEWAAQTLDDAKQMAIDFAEGVA